MNRSVQQPLPPMLLTNHSPDDGVRTNCSQDAEVTAAQLFDEALAAAKLTSKEVSALLGISESLVNRMRSPNYREGVSFTQLLRLPPAFHIALHRAMNQRFGFGRAALARLLDVAGDLALVVD
jgi:DNA-binding CsgD family transcriptional regulator